MAPPVLVLGGGNALGAYHAGAWAVLENEGVIPAWIVGTSIGAVTAAIIAGNAPGNRQGALSRFWNIGSSADAMSFFLPSRLRQPAKYAQALSSKIFGRPSLFTMRLPNFGRGDPHASVFDTEPMRDLLTKLIDFDRLNGGDIRLTMGAIDLGSGEEVVFDTTRMRVQLDHVMASAALIPDFPPVEVDGRLLVDGGLAANLPIHVALDEQQHLQQEERLTCFAVDLFPLAAPLPRGVLQASQRQSDLIFASQTRRALQALSRHWRGREPGADLFLMAYEALEQETAVKGFDFTPASLDHRTTAGQLDMRDLVRRWRQGTTTCPGLTIHTS